MDLDDLERKASSSRAKFLLLSHMRGKVRKRGVWMFEYLAQAHIPLPKVIVPVVVDLEVSLLLRPPGGACPWFRVAPESVSEENEA